MAEAIFEVVLPDYSEKFQPKFKFVITEKVLNLSTFKNYALEATLNLNIWILPAVQFNNLSKEEIKADNNTTDC